MAASLRKGAQCWLPSGTVEPFEKGEILEIEPLVVKLANGKEVSPRLADTSLANEYTEPDNTALVNLSDATLLANTRERFCADQIYTFTGSIVTSVNPCKPLPALYDAAAMQSARDNHKKEPLPHIFDTAEAAYSTLCANGRNQSIVVSGISGAGKTEAVKYIMRYICWRAAEAGGGGVSQVADLVMKSNPVFESLGNATTVNNPNSSRFGKFIRLRFDGSGRVAGALIDTYLLEKSRLPAQQPNERNFHVFYQMLAGAPDDTLSALSLQRSGRYNVLGGGLLSPFARIGAAEAGQTTSAEADPEVIEQLKGEYAAVRESMAALGLSADATSIYAGILHLGNITFEGYVPEGETAEEASRPDAAGEAALELAAKVLGIAPLRMVLTQRHVRSGGGRNSMYSVPLSVERASYTRDALAKKLYDGLFKQSVASINDVLRPPSGGEGDAEAEGLANRSIGLLDVFGFEIFEKNGFEQLMVNLANEKLQRFFLDAIFQREQDEYAREKLPWIPIVDVPDNSECIATIEAKPYGVVPLLDEQCRLGERGSDGALCELLNSKNSACTAAIAALGQRGKTLFRARERFTIRHFVQPVTYTAAHFIERNTDTFFGDLARAIATSSNAAVRGLISAEDVKSEETVAREGVGKSYSTVADGFVSDLRGLLEELSQTDAGFVRCIKPNSTLSPSTFDSSMVLHQLRTCGMVQAVKMMMSMYGARLAYTDIVAGWAASSGASWLATALGDLSPRRAVEQICAAFDVSSSEYAFGETRLFFRAGQAVGLSAFCRAPQSRADAIMRAVLLQWKLPMMRREQAVACGVARWLRAMRTRKHGRGRALAAEAKYVSAEAVAAGAVAASMVVDVSEEDAVEEVRLKYVAGLARAYRRMRRAYAVALVQARAQTRIAKHWRAFAARRRFREAIAARNQRAATLMQAAERRRRQQTELERKRAAAVSLQRVARGNGGRRKFARLHAQYVTDVTPHVLTIQKAWRATAPRRLLRASKAAALLIQSQWRMRRVWLLHKRLSEAVSFLRTGGVLSKYRFNKKMAGDFLQERHPRFVKLSDDMSTLLWAAPDKGGAQKTLRWDQIVAVTDGAKTSLMKKMNMRVERTTGKDASAVHGVVHAILPVLRPQDLETSCAFSIITKERTLDFVAPSRKLRDAWLANLQLLLVNRATFDSGSTSAGKSGKSATAKLMQRTEVVDEMRTMSMAIQKLRTKVSAAKLTLGRETSRMGTIAEYAHARRTGSFHTGGAARPSLSKASSSRLLAKGLPPMPTLSSVTSFSEDDIETLPEHKLKQLIVQAGLTHVDCASHSELVLRALEAKAAEEEPKPSPRYSYNGSD